MQWLAAAFHQVSILLPSFTPDSPPLVRNTWPWAWVAIKLPPAAPIVPFTLHRYQFTMLVLVACRMAGEGKTAVASSRKVRAVYLFEKAGGPKCTSQHASHGDRGGQITRGVGKLTLDSVARRRVPIH